jgi:hypothetical protein
MGGGGGRGRCQRLEQAKRGTQRSQDDFKTEVDELTMLRYAYLFNNTYQKLEILMM